MLAQYNKAWFQIDRSFTYDPKSKELVDSRGFVCFVFFDIDEDPRAGSTATLECLGPIRVGPGGPPRVFPNEQEAIRAGVAFVEQELGHQ